MPRKQLSGWMDGLDLLHEVASLGSLPCTCSGDRSGDSSCGNHPAMLPSRVLPSAPHQGAGTKTPPPLRELPGITRRGRVCDEVMNSVVGDVGESGMETRQEAEATDGIGAKFHHPFALHSPCLHKTVPYLGAS